MKESDDPNHDNIPDVAHHATVQLDAFTQSLLAGSVKMDVDYIKAYELVPGGSSTPPPATDTTAPTFLSGAALTAAASSASQINLSWPKATDNVAVAKYEVSVKGPTDANYRLIASPTTGSTDCPTTATGCTYASTGLTAATAYSYQVKALDAANNPSAILSASATTPALSASPPSSPVLTEQDGDKQATLTWTQATGDVVSSYEVWRDDVNTYISGLDSSARSFTVTGLTDGSTYRYRVVAYNSAGLANSNVVTLSPKAPSNADVTAPTVPTNLRVNPAATANSVPLAWDTATDNVGVAKYNILRNGSVIGTSTGLTYTDNTVAANTSYSYTVEAVDAVPNTGLPSSPPLSVTTPAAPDVTAPTAFTLSQGIVRSNQVNVNWTASSDPESGIKEYRVFRDGTQVGTVLPATCSATTCSFGETSGIASQVTYQYYVQAINGKDMSTQSNTLSVTTLAQDTVAPVITSIYPAAGNVSGQVNISASATDNVAVTKMELYIDSKLYATTTSGSIGYGWNTNPRHWQGSHTITIKAYDGASQSTTKSINLNVL